MLGPRTKGVAALLVLAGLIACSDDGADGAGGADGSGGATADDGSSTSTGAVGGGGPVGVGGAGGAAEELPDEGGITIWQDVEGTGVGHVSASFRRGRHAAGGEGGCTEVLAVDGCVVVHCPADDEPDDEPAEDDPAYVDAGTVEMRGDRGQVVLGRDEDGRYGSSLEGLLAGPGLPIEVTGSGADVPTFSVQVRTPGAMRDLSFAGEDRLDVRAGEDLDVAWTLEGTAGEARVVVYSIDDEAVRIGACIVDATGGQARIPAAIVAEVAKGPPGGLTVETFTTDQVAIGTHDVHVSSVSFSGGVAWNYLTEPCGACEGADQVVCNPTCGDACDDLVCADAAIRPPPVLSLGTTLVQIPAVDASHPRCVETYEGDIAWAIALEVPPEAQCLKIVDYEGVCSGTASSPDVGDIEPWTTCGESGSQCLGGGGFDPGPRYVRLVVPAGRVVEEGIVRVELGSTTDDCLPFDDCSLKGCGSVGE